MKIGLVGYQGCGKSTLFELLTGTAPDLSKTQTGQLGVAVVPDDRFDRLVALHNPKKIVNAKIELFDTPGLSRSEKQQNAGRLSVIREANALVHVIGSFSGIDAMSEMESFTDDLILADLELVVNRIKRLEKDSIKPRPDREELKAELESLQPIKQRLDTGKTLLGMELSELQEKVCRGFALLTMKKQLIVLNTEDSSIDGALLSSLKDAGHIVVSGPIGLELEVQSLPEEDRDEFAAEMGLAETCRERILQAIFEVTDLVTFFTSGEKEVHAWLLNRGSTVLEAADSIHSDLARGFVRAEIWQVEDLLKLGSERELKAAGLNRVVGKEYIVQDGDEVFIRSGV